MFQTFDNNNLTTLYVYVVLLCVFQIDNFIFVLLFLFKFNIYFRTQQFAKVNVPKMFMSAQFQEFLNISPKLSKVKMYEQ
jgi:hypothetical protein